MEQAKLVVEFLALLIVLACAFRFSVLRRRLSRRVVLLTASLVLVIVLTFVLLVTAQRQHISETQVRIFVDEGKGLQSFQKFASVRFQEGEVSGNFGRQLETFQETVSHGRNVVQRTRAAFEASSPSRSQWQASEILFDEIVRNYDALKPFKGLEDYRHSKEETLRAVETHYLTYAVVSGNRSLTFDLVVSSNPSGAGVSFKRKGSGYVDHPHVTETTVQNLVYAVWTIRLEKQGFVAAERMFDPFREKITSLNIELMKQ